MSATLNSSPLVLATPNSATRNNQQQPKAKTKPVSKDASSAASFSDCKTLNELKQLQCHLIKQGLSTNPSYAAKVISTYAQMGISESLNYAQKTFDIFKKDNENTATLFMYNSLIRGYSFIGLGVEAVLLYVELLSFGMLPDKYTFPFVLSACTKSSAYNEGVQVHGAIIKRGFAGDLFVENSLVHFYGACGDIDDGRKVFDQMSDRNVVSWTSLICAYARRDFPKEAVDLFFDMVEEGITTNSVTMVCVISACAKLQDLDLGERVCAYIGELGMKVNSLMVNALVDMYMKCGAVGTAKQLFDECRDWNLDLCNTVMSNYVRQGMAREALSILDEMLLQGLRPDRFTMLSAISASAQLGDLLCGKLCHAYCLRNGLEGCDYICNSMIDMYMNCGKQELACLMFDRTSNKGIVYWNSLIAGFIRNGDLESAWKLFGEMPETDLVSWNTILGALTQESMFEEAIEFFREMQSKGIKADRITMVGVASACGYLGSLDLAKWIYTYIQKNGIYCDMRLETALVDMFAKCGDPQSAMQVFNRMEKRDVSAWTAAIGAKAMEGNGEQAVELFNKMLRQGVKPDDIVFVAVLTACSHGGLVEQGWTLFRSMKEIHGISPQIVHFGCMVDLLGRAGLLDDAIDLIKSMPMEPNDVIWGSLLAACRKHQNVHMAAYAAERITELTPDKSGIRVLLSNMYASAGKWSDVARVRLHMKERGLQKVPGSSSIEANGKVHEFTSGDESHPEMTSISLMLHEMNCRFRDAGHVPDLTNVLLDVDEQEKEHLLNHHSEKLAMAFGLISTTQRMPIRIVKNLRMCSDCHSFAKLVSKIYEREIIIRDNNRFHFCQRGVCSCNDFW